MKKLIVKFSMIWIILIITSCDNEDDEGCCVGCCDPDNLAVGLNEYYCYNGWSKSDCDKFKRDNVNGVDWKFYPGKTCENKGFQSGN